MTKPKKEKPEEERKTDPSRITPASKDQYDVGFHKMVKYINTASEEEKTKPWNIDLSTIVIERRFKVWPQRRLLPENATAVVPNMTHFLPLPLNDPQMTLAARWNAGQMKVLSILWERMQAGKLEDLLAPGYHPVARYHAEKIAVKFRMMSPEYWNMEAEDVEAIYQAQRDLRNPSFVTDLNVTASCLFDRLLPLIMHLKKGHFSDYDNPRTEQLLVRRGAMPWGKMARMVRCHYVGAEEALAEWYPPFWTCMGNSKEYWWKLIKDKASGAPVAVPRRLMGEDDGDAISTTWPEEPAVS